MIAVMIPFVGIIAFFVDATILHIVYKALGGKGTYEGTAKFVLYSSAALSLIWIPLVGWIFGIYQVYLYIVGGKFVHDISMEIYLAAIILFILLIPVFAVLYISQRPCSGSINRPLKRKLRRKKYRKQKRQQSFLES